MTIFAPQVLGAAVLSPISISSALVYIPGNSGSLSNTVGIIVSGTLLYGDGPPFDSLGSDDDSYLDRLTLTLYGPRKNGSWPEGLQIGTPSTNIVYASPGSEVPLPQGIGGLQRTIIHLGIEDGDDPVSILSQNLDGIGRPGISMLTLAPRQVAMLIFKDDVWRYLVS